MSPAQSIAMAKHDHHQGHGHDSHAHHAHHAQGQAHGHDHGPLNHDRAFAFGIALNLLFVVIEAYWGWRAHSLALVADAAHNLSDVAGLVLAWAGAWAGRIKPNTRYTYGWRRASIVAAFLNALLLLVAMGSLGWEAVQRLGQSASPQGMVVMMVAAIGMAINGLTAWLFMRGAHDDLNLRGAFMHMAADALVSLGVVVAGGLVLWMGWGWIDPVVSLLIAVVIVLGTWGLFKQSLRLMLDGVPEHVDAARVRSTLLSLPGVTQVDDLHVWAMGTTQVALTAHIVVPEGTGKDDSFLHQAVQRLQEDFAITHVTLQVARESQGAPCLAPTLKASQANR